VLSRNVFFKSNQMFSPFDIDIKMSFWHLIPIVPHIVNLKELYEFIDWFFWRQVF